MLGRDRIITLFSIILLAGALWFLSHLLESYHLHDIIRYLGQIPAAHIAWAVVLTMASYATMVGYDYLGVRYVGRSLPYRQVAWVSFISYAFSYNTGFALLTGGATRYRFYSGWGFSAAEIANIILYCSVAFLLGMLLLGGIALLVSPPIVTPDFSVGVPLLEMSGSLCLLLLAAGLLLSFRGPPTLRLGPVSVAVPQPRLMLQQLGLSTFDWLVAATVLWVLLPASATLPFAYFLTVFIAAQMLGLVSHIPGGLGVFETVVVYMLAPYLPLDQVAGSLLLFRAIYYLLPFVVALAGLGVYEFGERWQALSAQMEKLAGLYSSITVPLLTLASFAAGTMLLLLGATPVPPESLGVLKQMLPVEVLEISHFATSIIGVALLVLARGLQRRYDAAYFLTLLLTAGAAVFVLLKGLHFLPAAFLIFVFVLLLPSRGSFFRRSSLLSASFSVDWLLAIGTVVGISFWLGMFSYKHVEYSNELWWQFTFYHGEAPRFLRASAGVAIALLVFFLLRLLRARPLHPERPSPADIEDARRILAAQPFSEANLALLGDKYLLFNPSRTAFIMYAIQQRYWVAMGDPVGSATDAKELVWQFRELCDRFDVHCVYYQVHAERVHQYMEMGLEMFKLGEEARVSLGDFSLQGSRYAHLRQAKNRAEREGLAFDIVPVADLPAILPELKAVSDAWLGRKQGDEKSFSMGRFEAAYMQNFPVAVVKREDRIIAFANLWFGGQEELSVDLMRHLPDAPGSCMDYLFIMLMLWGRDQGYRRFSLGMAPLSGFSDHPLASSWSKLADAIFERGNRFYNFEGLQRFKDKFEPVWSPRYLICPGGLALPGVLLALTRLISGGLKGVVKG